MARPLNTINWELLDQLLGIFCTGEECASVLNVDYETICRAIKREKKMGFEEYSAIKKGSGRASLRRRQFRMAETNPALAIWLGKQYLGQTDNMNQYIKTDQTITVVFEKDSSENNLQAPRFATPSLQ